MSKYLITNCSDMKIYSAFLPERMMGYHYLPEGSSKIEKSTKKILSRITGLLSVTEPRTSQM
jgi:hypothetical protein